MANSLTITLVQSDLYWEDIEANLAAFEEKLWTIDESTDLIVLPEMFSTGFTMEAEKVSEPMNSKTFRWMKQMAVQKDAMVMGSYVVKEKQQYYNRLLCVRPDGTFEKYDKRHLFIGGEDKHYHQGKERLLIEWRGWKLLPLICYDLRFPVFARSKKNSDEPYEYDAVIYIANWPSARVFAWTQLLKARAIENQAFSIGVNRIGKGGNKLDYTGQSALYDYLGHDILDLDDRDEIRSITIEKGPLEEFRKKFPFQLDADDFDIHL